MNNQPLKLLLLDVDGVLTTGQKTYDRTGLCISKEFCDQDFTAIKKFRASGVNVVWVSGDENINHTVATNRNIRFVYSKEKNFDCLPTDLKGVATFSIGYVGDDIYDLPLLKQVSYAFCPLNSAPEVVNYVNTVGGGWSKNKDGEILTSRGGYGVVSELYEWFRWRNLVPQYDLDALKKLDLNECY